MKVEIIRQAEDRCSGATWAFSLNLAHNKATLLLEFYSEWSRPTPRHKARPNRDRTYVLTYYGAGNDHRHWLDQCRYGRGWVPPVPKDVEREARDRLAVMLARIPLDSPTQEDIDRERERQAYRALSGSRAGRVS